MAHWEAELAELVARRGRALVGYAYVLSGDHREAEDLVQDALVKVFSRLRGPAPGTSWDRGPRPTEPTLRAHDLRAPGFELAPASAEGYVRRAILTLYLDRYRRRRRWAGVRHLVAEDESSRGPESGATARADVAAALERLTPKQRACVVLRYFEDLTVPQIATALGVAQGTVKRHLADATVTLRGALSVPGDTPRHSVPERRSAAGGRAAS